MPGMDVEQLVAIDVHVHAERNTNEPQDPVTGEVLAAAARSFGGSPPQPTAQEVADHYRERNIAAVIFTVDDDSGWSPKYFPENLIRYTNGPLKHKMLFGSDYPLITPTAGSTISRSWRSRTRSARLCSRTTPRGC